MSNNNGTTASPSKEEPKEETDRIIFPATAEHDPLDESHLLFSRASRARAGDDLMMGPILRRKRVVSMPLGQGGA
jgi:hypothetical protein